MFRKETFIIHLTLCILIATPLFALKKERITSQTSDSSTTIRDHRGSFDGYVEITNNTGNEIYYLYLTHEDDTVWGDDLLGDLTLNSGESYRVDLKGFASSYFDIYAKDSDDDW